MTDRSGATRAEGSGATRADGNPAPSKAGERATIDPKIAARVPAFMGLDEAEVQPLLAIATVQSVDDGTIVVEEGLTSQNLWVVLEGACEVITNRPRANGSIKTVVLATLEAFANFGEMSFFHIAPHAASVRAKGHLKLLCIARADFDRLVEKRSFGAFKLAVNLIGSLAERMRRMDHWVSQLVDTAAAEAAAKPNPPAEVAQAAEWARFRDQLFRQWNL